VAVLFPGEGARTVDEWPGDKPRTLIVVDGTWSQAKKMLKHNPQLAALPRIALVPDKPGNYRIRKEPTDQHLATIEATAQILGALEGDPTRFDALLTPFTAMVDRQIAFASRSTQSRHRRRTPKAHKHAPELLPVLDHPARAVVMYAEGNCASAGAGAGAELIHLVALRPFVPGAVLDLVLRPRRPLGERVEERLGLSLAAIHGGVSVADALAQLHAFVGEDFAFLASWGSYARDLLHQEGEPRRGFIDLRALVARQLQRSAGGIELAAEALGVPLSVAPAARAVLRSAALAQILVSLVERARLP
jgi:hypothetical protein